MRIDLSQLRPCDQEWANMAPSGQGRLCAKCEKQIVDFRRKSPLEIGVIHANREQPVCGLYSPAQLQGEQPTTPSRLSRILPVATGLSLLGGGAAVAQEPAAPVEQVPSSAMEVRSAFSPSEEVFPAVQPVPVDTLVLRGIVRDSATLQPISGVAVVVKGTDAGALTNARGEYVLPLPASRYDHPLVIVASQIGYSRVEREILPEKGTDGLDMILPAATVELSAFYVTAPEPKRSWWQWVGAIVGWK